MNGQQFLLTRWRQLATGSHSGRIFSAAITVGGITLGVKFTSMLKEMIVAAWFGTGDDLDAFLIAFLVLSYIINVVAGSFTAALIPIQIEVRENEGADAAQRLFSGTVAFSSILLISATIILAATGPFFLPLLCSGFSPGKLRLTEELFYVLLPIITISGLLTNWEAVLNAGERFGLVAAAPAIVPVVIIGFIITLGPSLGIQALALGSVSGFLLQLGLLGWALMSRGMKIMPKWHGLHPAMRRVIGQYLPAVAAATLMCSTILVDQAMASTLEPGSVARLSYGNKIVALLLSIGTSALGTAVLPYFSKMVAAKDWAGLRQTLRTYVGLILTITVPLSITGIILSRPITAMLFQRGQFTESDTILVAGIQSMFLMQVPFYTLTILFVRTISSLQANHVLMWGTVISVILNVTLNYLLMRVWGVAGIALSTTLVYVVLSAFLGTMLYRKLKVVEGGVAA